MKKFNQFINIDEVSTGKLVDYVAAASKDVGRRIEKNEPGIEPFKKTLKRSGHIGRAMARIKIKSKANEQNDMCNVCGQTPCNCTSIEEGAELNRGPQRPSKYTDPRVDLEMKATKKEYEHRAKHFTAAKAGDQSTADKEHKRMRKFQSIAGKINQARSKDSKDYSAAIAKDYKDQEAKRGIGHVRDSVEMDDSKTISEARPRRANTASARADLAKRPKKELSQAEKDKNKESSDAAWERLMAYAAAQKKTNEEVGQVDELKLSTLKSYIGKAKAQKDYKQGVYNMRHQGLAAGKTHADWSPEGRAIVKKRNAGIGQAHTKVIDKMNAAMREDVSQIDEISQELKNRYVERAVTAHGGYNMARRNTTGKVKEYFARKEANTKKGISRALRKEEVEQVSELKTSTLLRYTTKATRSSEKLGGEGGQAIDSGDRATAAKKFTKRDNRFKGIMKAHARITGKK